MLKDENLRLKSIAINYSDVERMKLENKQMRIELQRLKNIAISDINSNYNVDQSPKSS